MIKVNEAGWDRGIRILIGGVLLYFGGAGTPMGWMGGVSLALGIILVLTGLIGWCPLYSLLGISTRHPSPTDAGYT